MLKRIISMFTESQKESGGAALSAMYPVGSFIWVDPRYYRISKYPFHLHPQEVVGIEEPRVSTKDNPYADDGGVWVRAPDRTWINHRAFIGLEFVLGKAN